MVLYVHRNPRLITDVRLEVRERGRLDTCRHQNDVCIKMGSDESHFNVSLVVRDKAARVSTNHNLSEEKTTSIMARRGCQYRTGSLSVRNSGL